MGVFEQFEIKKDYLVCVDSDGCAMDTMDIKHIRCFGPVMVKEWGLETWAEPILNRWNALNLYTMTRGINRFLALSLSLSEIHEKTCHIDGIGLLNQWTKQAAALSEAELEKIIQEGGHPIFKKALFWSQTVNREIKQLPPSELKPFPGAKEGLHKAHQYTDIAIVSSANEEAVREEWNRYGMMDSADICLTQSAGSKAYCIEKMLEKGYRKNRVLMVGDAPGDRQAAEKNGVLYYPILVKHEPHSWQQFAADALPRLLEGRYEGPYQLKMNQAFEENLA